MLYTYPWPVYCNLILICSLRIYSAKSMGTTGACFWTTDKRITSLCFAIRTKVQPNHTYYWPIIAFMLQLFIHVDNMPNAYIDCVVLLGTVYIEAYAKICRTNIYSTIDRVIGVGQRFAVSGPARLCIQTNSCGKPLSSYTAMLVEWEDAISIQWKVPVFYVFFLCLFLPLSPIPPLPLHFSLSLSLSLSRSLSLSTNNITDTHLQRMYDIKYLHGRTSNKKGVFKAHFHSFSHNYYVCTYSIL